MSPNKPPATKFERVRPPPRQQPPDLYQVIIECLSEAEQRELFERLRREGKKVRLLVL
jgi:hypothetical protein